MSMTLALAKAIVAGALAEARARGTRPMAVFVADAGGHVIAFEREDETSLFRFDICRAKAVGALGLGSDTREIAQRSANNPPFFLTVAIATGGNLALSPGGLLIRDDGGKLIGAVGVSGNMPDLDEAVGLAGIRAAGLRHPGNESRP